MRKQLRSAITNLDNLKAIVSKMRKGTDEEATMVLARLRLGTPIEKVVQKISTEPMYTEYSNGQSSSSIR